MKSIFYDKVDKNKPLNEYPRPNLIRDNYTNINGIWKYQIINKNDDLSSDWKDIVVPFGVNTNLSGVLRSLKPSEELYYKKVFKYKKSNDKTILHFEAVDSICEIYLNNNFVGKHYGAYSCFEFDVSDYIKENNELVVRVRDYSELGFCAYGKQRLNPKNIWYTPISGIWQSVWLEDVSNDYISNIFIKTDFDNRKVNLELVGEYSQAIITILENDKIVYREITNQNSIEFVLDEIREWNEFDPFLYDIFIRTDNDFVKSYFGFRKIEKVKLKEFNVLAINNRPTFLTSILDQGYNPDSNLTYQSEEAMLYDLTLIKEMGFNCIRKHVKVENRRWYYLCDKLGIYVIQDMVNGGKAVDITSFNQIMGTLNINVKEDYKKFGRLDIKSRNMFYQELNDMVLNLFNNPSVIIWTLFNEGWGQFDSRDVYEFLLNIDDSRLVDVNSGWFDTGVGDFNSRHVYFRKYKHSNDLNRISILSEFGGYKLVIKNHFDYKISFGYKKINDSKKLEEEIINLYKRDIIPYINKGLCACVYTQLTDVESESNGLITYDRKVLKIDAKKIRELNKILREGL